MKNLKNLGKALSKAEQKTINGGRIPDLYNTCGFILFNSTEQQCLNLGYKYRPIWIPSTNKCSALGQGTNCVEA